MEAKEGKSKGEKAKSKGKRGKGETAKPRRFKVQMQQREQKNDFFYVENLRSRHVPDGRTGRGTEDCAQEE